jgi:TfoX/Sxy family transcriptional regulator of competence genes
METELARRIRAKLRGPQVSEKRMFGGVCFMWNGNMLVAASERGLLVRVGKDGHEAALKKPHTRPMVQGKRAIPGYIHVADDGTRRDADLTFWLDVARAEVASLPAKAPAAAKKKPPAGKKTTAKAKVATKAKR